MRLAPLHPRSDDVRAHAPRLTSQLRILPVLLCLALPLAAAETAPPMATRTTPAAESKRQKVERLIDLTRVADLMLDGILMRIGMLPLSEETKRRLTAEATRESLVEALAPVYEKNMTEEELDGALAFYLSPIGKSLSEKQPDVYRGSQEAINAWLEKLLERAK